jgi:hypothetical protein
MAVATLWVLSVGGQDEAQEEATHRREDCQEQQPTWGPEVWMGCRPMAHPGSNTSSEYAQPPIDMQRTALQLTVHGMVVQTPLAS